MDSSSLVIDYLKINSFSKRYLQTYYKNIDPDELEIAKFLVEEYKKIKGKPKMLEIGCGPTVHHILPAAPYVSQIHMADYLPQNLNEIKLWKYKPEKAHTWNHFTKKILELEGHNPTIVDVANREDSLRNIIKKFSLCNVLKDPPVSAKEKYPVVGFFYCAEEVTTSITEWRVVMRRVSDLISKGGQLLLKLRQLKGIV